MTAGIVSRCIADDGVIATATDNRLNVDDTVGPTTEVDCQPLSVKFA